MSILLDLDCFSFVQQLGQPDQGRLHKLFLLHLDPTKDGPLHVGLSTIKGWVFSSKIFSLVYLFQHCKFQMSIEQEPAFFIRQFWLALTELVLIFIPNYFAERVLSKSNQLLRMAYDCYWYQQSPEFKKIFVVFMENLKNPIKFWIVGIFELNLGKFLETCNAIYSLYTILKQFWIFVTIISPILVSYLMKNSEN